MPQNLSVKDCIRKLEQYCAYQERCHQEVTEKARSFGLTASERDEALVHLIQHNFLNEERFARAFTRGKHRIKKWGYVRITNELKLRNISPAIINIALREISRDEYEETFENLSVAHWESLGERNLMRKRKKFCDFLLRKGYETDMVYARMKELEQHSDD